MKKIISVLLVTVMLCTSLVFAGCDMLGGADNVYVNMAAAIVDAGYDCEIEILYGKDAVVEECDFEDAVSMAELYWWNRASDDEEAEVVIIEFESEADAENRMEELMARYVVEQYEKCLLLADRESDLAPLTADRGAPCATVAGIFNDLKNSEANETEIEYICDKREVAREAEKIGMTSGAVAYIEIGLHHVSGEVEGIQFQSESLAEQALARFDMVGASCRQEGECLFWCESSETLDFVLGE